MGEEAKLGVSGSACFFPLSYRPSIHTYRSFDNRLRLSWMLTQA
jgi:hypothetical protein